MVKSYHVICIPLYHWEAYQIRTKSQLLTFSEILKRMFSFEIPDESGKDYVNDESIIYSPLIWHSERYSNMKEITELLNKNLIESLQILHIFITDYSFEIISSNPKIFDYSGVLYSELAEKISKITFKDCFKDKENASIFENPAVITRLKITACDKLDEIKELAMKDELDKVNEYFYIDKCTPFFLKSSPWKEISIPDSIVTLKPKIMIENMGIYHSTADELGIYVTMVHAIGKIFTISESISGASANLAVSSWNFDDIFQDKNLFGLEKDFNNLVREFKERVQYLTLLSNPMRNKFIMQKYGEVTPWIEDTLTTLQDERVQKIMNNSDEVIGDFKEEQKFFGKTLIEFINGLQDAANIWSEINRSKINHQTIFNIGSQTAGRDIYNIAGSLNITQNSPPEDVLKVIQAIEQKVGELDIDDKNRKEIAKQLESAKVELDSENPDKNSIIESIKKTNEIFKEVKTTGETLKEIGILVGKASVWLGTTKAALGWIF